MRIALAGGGQLALRLLEGLIESGHDVVALVQDGRQTRGFRRWLYPLIARATLGNRTVLGLARMRGIPLHYIDKMNESELAPIRALEPDLIIVGGFSIILKAPILTLPKIGCVNCHTALLPKHRGPHPCAWVIIQNEPETGVTFHAMDEGIDTGDILAQGALAITGKDTSGSLHMRLSDLAKELLPDLLAKIAANGLQGTPQNDEEATYEPKIKGDRRLLDWAQPAVDLERKVRACFPYYVARFKYDGKEVIVSRAKANPKPREEAPGTIVATRPRVRVATGEGTLQLTIAYTMKPIPWAWPSPRNRPRVGDKLP